LAVTAFAAAQTNSTTDTTATATTTVGTNVTEIPFGGLGLMMGDRGFGEGPGGRGCPGRGFGGYAGNIEVSAAYNQTVTNILGNDSDVKNLVSQGYTLTTIRPLVQSVISADGTVTTQATTAIVTMQNGASGYATVKVDITNAKVSQIVILTRTVIDKTTS
jgi:hypothetical protein